ncbi:hypothetical protein JCM14469_26970 [Desulfatiferula olefinivorans]
MKRKGCSILFVNRRNRLLLFLRDDKPGLPHAGMWDLPGGHVEDGESPDQCIVREMNEELGLDLDDVSLFRIYDFEDRLEYVYVKAWDPDITTLKMTEGQGLRWFSEDDIRTTELAYGFNHVCLDFFNERKGQAIAP